MNASGNAVAIVALGANLGAREETLRAALRKLENSGARVLAISHFYETEPVGYANQPDFLNAVAALEIVSEISPESLMAQLLEIEKKLGRERSFPNAPRTCDLDLIFFGTEKRDSATLVLPHPRWRERAFVLVPLAEILSAPAQWNASAPWREILSETRSALAVLDCSGVRLVE